MKSHFRYGWDFASVCVCTCVCAHVYVCVCVHAACMRARTTAHMWRWEGNLWELVLFFHHMGPVGLNLAANTFTPLAILLVLSMLSSFQDANKGERGGSSLKWRQSGTTISS